MPRQISNNTKWEGAEVRSSEFGPYHYVERRLHDGVSIRLTPVVGHPWMVNVSIMAPRGWIMYQGCLNIIDALAEIPYQLDRARILESQIAWVEEAPCTTSSEEPSSD